MCVLSLSFCFGIVGRDPDVFTRHERRHFDARQNRANRLDVPRALEAVDGRAKVGGRNDEVHVKVAVGVEVQGLRAALWAGPELLTAASELV